jgi:hypothetical protein
VLITHPHPCTERMRMAAFGGKADNSRNIPNVCL